MEAGDKPGRYCSHTVAAKTARALAALLRGWDGRYKLDLSGDRCIGVRAAISLVDRGLALHQHVGVGVVATAPRCVPNRARLTPDPSRLSLG